MNVRLSRFQALVLLVGSSLFLPKAQAQPIRLDLPPADNRPALVTRSDGPAPSGSFSTGGNILAEVEKMVQSGTDPAVIKSFVQNWTGRFSVTADQILRLHDIGASTEI